MATHKYWSQAFLPSFHPTCSMAVLLLQIANCLTSLHRYAKITGPYKYMALSKQVRLWVDIVLIAFVMLFPHYGHLPMYAYPFVVLGVIWIYLNLNGESFNSIGFRFSDLKWRAFYAGGAIGLAYAAFHFWILGPFIT